MSLAMMSIESNMFLKRMSLLQQSYHHSKLSHENPGIKTGQLTTPPSHWSQRPRQSLALSNCPKRVPHHAQCRCAVHWNSMQKMLSNAQLQTAPSQAVGIAWALHACAMCFAQRTCAMHGNFSGARRTVANSSLTGGRLCLCIACLCNAQCTCAVHWNTMQKCSAMHSCKQLHHRRQALHVHCMLVQCALLNAMHGNFRGARRTVANSSITGGRHSPSDRTDLPSHKCAMTIATCYAVCSDHQVWNAMFALITRYEMAEHFVHTQCGEQCSAIKLICCHTSALQSPHFL